MKFIQLFAFLSLVIFGLQSCEDEIEPTTAQIYVIDEEGNPVSDANVILACTSSINKICDIELEGVTNSKGKVVFDLELPAVLQVEASKVVYDTNMVGWPNPIPEITLDSVCGNTFISVLQEEVNTKTVVLFSCN